MNAYGSYRRPEEQPHQCKEGNGLAKTYKLSVGQTKKIKAKIVKAKRRKKLLHGNKLRYWSSDPLVATVSTGGQIKAVGAGNCTVWICAMNG